MSQRLGYVYGISAYLAWGAFPLFFNLLADVDPLEIVPWRVITALVFCVIVVTAVRGWSPIAAILGSRRMSGWFLVSTVLLYANWQVFIIAVTTGHIIEAALGYFINPVVTILIGVFVRKERLSAMQWIAVGVATVGVVGSAVAYGKFPIYALGLAFSFALYGAVRKQVSDHIDALTGLTVETLFGTVIAVVQLGLVAAIWGGLHAFDHGPGVSAILLSSGVVTAIPLLLFAAGNRRMPLSHMGFVQFLTPILTFLSGYFIYHEEMPPARWFGFLAVWVALVVLVVDMVRAIRSSRRAAPPPLLATGEIGVQPGP